MQLIGYLDSPFVRRVAITMRCLDIDYENRELSIFRDFEEFSRINPTVKVPTLVLDDGEFLIDSTLIIDYLETHVAGRSLMPKAADKYLAALQHIGVAMVAMEKVAQLIYETTQRPEETQHKPWFNRLAQQIEGAVDLLEAAVTDSVASGNRWLLGDELTQADISVAVAWRFILHIDCVKIEPADYPALTSFSQKAEELPEFLECPLSS